MVTGHETSLAGMLARLACVFIATANRNPCQIEQGLDKTILLSNGSPIMPNSSIRMVPAGRAHHRGAMSACGDDQAEMLIRLLMLP
jgi:hypothetical protein